MFSFSFGVELGFAQNDSLISQDEFSKEIQIDILVKKSKVVNHTKNNQSNPSVSTPPKPPSNVKVDTIYTNGFYMTWTPVSNVKYYMVYIDGEPTKCKGAWYRANKLSPNTSYQIQVSSVNKDGEGRSSSTVTIETKTKKRKVKKIKKVVIPQYNNSNYSDGNYMSLHGKLFKGNFVGHKSYFALKVYVSEIVMNGGKKSGTYYYYKYPNDVLTLNGTIDEMGYIIMHEYDRKDGFTGTFKGRYNGSDIISGNWYSSNGKRKLKFYMENR
jgi:hypothetical protein